MKTECMRRFLRDKTRKRADGTNAIAILLVLPYFGKTLPYSFYRGFLLGWSFRRFINVMMKSQYENQQACSWNLFLAFGANCSFS